MIRRSLTAWVGVYVSVGLGCLALACAAPARTPYRSLASGSTTPATARAESRGELDATAQHWRKLFLQSGGQDPTACREAARALMAAGEPEDALEVLSMGLEAAPGNPELLETQGNALAQAGFSRAAERSFEDALFASPDRVSALRSLGRMRLELNRSSAALIPLERSLELGATDTETRLLLGRALACTGRTDEAFCMFATAFGARDATATELVDAAALMLDSGGIQGNRVTIQAWLERSVELTPTRARAHYYLGVVHEDRKQSRAAVRSWRRAVALDPGHVEALERLAESHKRRGNVELSARLTRRAEQAAKQGHR